MVRDVPALGRARPDAQRHLPRSGRRAAAHRRSGLRRPLSAADSSDRHELPEGRNNALIAGPGDPGSPWAIGSTAGGHTAVEPGLGTLDDFDAFRAKRERLGLEVALDLAWQCSPDHPWVREHPEWFRHRPDGTIKYAENPPKKYQDIYPFDFECEDWRALWQALLDVTLFWIDHGVRIFRVDNPHTKTFGFWEWMIDAGARAASRRDLPRRGVHAARVMRYLAKAGSRSRTPTSPGGTPRRSSTEYFTELTRPRSREYLRPNLFANTPDILHAYLQQGGRPAFEARLLLAATLGASYGIYSGFELCEGQAVARHRGVRRLGEVPVPELGLGPARPHQGAGLRASTQIRRAHRALQFDTTLRFHATDNPEIIAYSKRCARRRRTTLLVVVNLDPHHTQHGHVRSVRCRTSGPARGYASTICSPTRVRLARRRNYVRFDPGVRRRTGTTCSFDPDIRQGHDPVATDTPNSDRPRRLAVASAAAADDDPLWYKDAIIYQAHVKSFFDSNNDGIGDFQGLTAEARLPAGPRHHLPVAAAVLSLAAQGRRLRHRRLSERPSELRHARRLQGVRRRRARAAASRC